MKITFLSHTAMGGDFVVGSHHLAASLAARGHEVLHVSAPVTPAHVLGLADDFVRTRLARWWRGGETLRQVRDVVPFSPLPWAMARAHPALMHAHSRAMLAAPLRGVGSLRLAQADQLIVDEPRFVGAALSRSSQATLTYRATDLYAAMRGDARIAEAERELCRHAAAVVATSENIAAHLRALSGRHVEVISNGVDFAHFSAPCRPGPASEVGRAKRAVYVGAFDARFCVSSLRVAALAYPSRDFVLAGPGAARVAAELGLRNVEAVGAVPYEALPALLQSCAVGMLPFSASAANAGRSPMKLFEYAAAGLTVAASHAFHPGSVSLPTLCRASDPDDFARAVGAAFDMASDATRIVKAREIARAQDWNAKATELLRVVQQARAETARPPSMPEAAPLLPARSSWN
jgi:teichuronic acid biosynthesis glycosyltransferase TuaH